MLERAEGPGDGADYRQEGNSCVLGGFFWDWFFLV